MKVKIGKYVSWIGPYQIADKIIFWQDKYNDECKWANRAYALGTWLANDKDGNDSALTKFCTWASKLRKRQEYVHIDEYDVWNLNNTLGLIALPLLIKLKEVKQGFALIADEDVPEAMRSTAAPTREHEWDWDSNAEARYTWFLDELIWAFTALTDDEADSKFYEHAEKIPGEDFMDTIRRMKVDREGLDAFHKRKAHAFLMFGKYYESLWD